MFCDPLRLAGASWRAAARRKGERVHSLLIVLFQREAAAADFGDAADDEEALRVDGMNELFQLGQFTVGNNAQQHFAGVAGVAALAVASDRALMILTCVRLSPIRSILSMTMVCRMTSTMPYST